MEKTKPEILKVRIRNILDMEMKNLKWSPWIDDGFVKKIGENLYLIFFFFIVMGLMMGDFNYWS